MEDLVAKQSATIKHVIEESYVGSGPILIPTVSVEILAKVIDYCVICSVAFSVDEAELKSFVDEHVNDHEPTLFSLLQISWV